MSKALCIYHGNCADGFGAAWAVRRALGDANVEFVAGVYGRAPPDVTGRDVIMVDFSYKRPVIDQMGVDCRSMLILDHHKSAQQDLVGLPRPLGLGWGTHLDDVAGWGGADVDPRLPRALFDMERSGAGLVWDFFHPNQPRPALLDHIEDRDLWRFALPDTREIQAALYSHPYDFEIWDHLVARCESLIGREVFVTEGRAIERKHHKDIAELLPLTRREMVIGGVTVPVANLPYTMASDAASLLAQGVPFGACYYDGKDGRVFSLRSREGGVDVSVIASSYGGGGHAAASGFTAAPGWEGDAPIQAFA